MEKGGTEYPVPLSLTDEEIDLTESFKQPIVQTEEAKGINNRGHEDQADRDRGEGARG
jgi:hypothetical protein